ncbi:MAG: AP2 domain-containing protein [Phycisphaerales bacterium]
MVKYALPLYLPVFLDRVSVAPLLLLRRIWYGYAFRRIKLANSDKYAIVDPCDFAELSKYTWLLDCEYGCQRVIRLSGRVSGHVSVHMHRQILADELEAKNSALSVRLFVDHINCNALDNRRANLRIVTRMQNAKNRSKSKKKCSSIYKGVSWNKSSKKWCALIRANHKPIYLGYFDDEIEAAKAYDAAAKKYHKEFACLNFPPPNKKGLKNLLKYWFKHELTQIYTNSI